MLPIVVTQKRGQRLRLTPQGADLADAALVALRDLDQAAAKLREAHSATRVIVAAPPSVANRWLLPRLSRIEAECAGVEVSIIVDTVRMGELDPYADLSLRRGCARSPAERSILSDRMSPFRLWEQVPGSRRGDPTQPVPCDLFLFCMIEMSGPRGPSGAIKSDPRI